MQYTIKYNFIYQYQIWLYVTLIEIMSAAFTQYRSGIVYAIQYGDFDAAIIFVRNIIAMLPEPSRPVLPDIPTATDLKGDLADKRYKWAWLMESSALAEEAISKWIHMNLARMSM